MKRAKRSAKGRAGLSTLEMVLCLPLLLFIMALMINFGTAAAWKVRTLVSARHAAWANRWPRDPSQMPRAENWPQSGSSGVGNDADITELDDGRLEYPVVRGPLPYGAAIDPDMYDLMTLSHGARKGEASIEREYPLLPKLGPYKPQATCALLDNDWRYQRLPWENDWFWADNHNERRRIPVIYDLGIISQQKDLVESLYEYGPFRNAWFAMAGAIHWDDFKPLGGPGLYNDDLRDDEDYFYENYFPDTYIDPQGVLHNIAFGRHMHRILPRLTEFCSLDETLINERVENLIDRIQGNSARHISSVPDRLASMYRGLYDAVLRRFQNPWPNDPAPQPGEVSALEKKKEELSSGF